MIQPISRRLLLQSAVALGVIASSADAAEDKTHGSVGDRDLADLERLIAERATRYRIPGLAAVVVERGRPAAMFLHGQASIPFSAPVTEHTRFYIASVAKHVIAVAILRLVDAGRLRLDAPIGTYLEKL